MRLWRICRRPFADLSGEGARLYGGRWNSPGSPMVYAAESAALAILEVRVHLDLSWDLLPTDYVLLEIETDGAAIEHSAPVADTVRHGDAWLASLRTPLMKIPSVIAPESFNLLINPSHPEAARIAIVSLRPFIFDDRLWLPKV